MLFFLSFCSKIPLKSGRTGFTGEKYYIKDCVLQRIPFLMLPLMFDDLLCLMMFTPTKKGTDKVLPTQCVGIV